MENVKLIPEQIAYIQKKLEQLSQETSKLRRDVTDRESRPTNVSSFDGFDHIPDFTALQGLGKVKNKMVEFSDLLNSAIIITDYDSEKINIGTRFTATLDFGDGDLTTEEYILIEGPIIIKKGINYISTNSPFGKAVYGKKENDVIHYYTPDHRLIGGLVETIASSRNLEENTKSIEDNYQYTLKK